MALKGIPGSSVALARSLAALAVAATALLVGPKAQAFTIQLDDKGAAIRSWRNSEITFDVNYADCLSQGVSEAQVNDAIDRALQVWSFTPSSDLRLNRGASVSKTSDQILAQATGGNPLILCDSQLGAHLAGPGEPPVQTNSILAVAKILRLDSERRIALAVVYLNAEPGKASNIGNVIRIPDFPSIVLAHEIGHALGLGHTADVHALMYSDATVREKLSLAQDDMAGIAYLYPRHELVSAGLFGCGTIERVASRSAFEGTGEALALLLACWGMTQALKRAARAQPVRLAS